MLSEWNRSRSFPPPKSQTPEGQAGTTPGGDNQNSQGVDETGAFVEGLPRKPSLPLTASTMSINSNVLINDGKPGNTPRATTLFMKIIRNLRYFG